MCRHRQLPPVQPRERFPDFSTAPKRQPMGPSAPLRRHLLARLAWLGATAGLPAAARSQTASAGRLLSLQEMTLPLTGAAPVTLSGIRLELPGLADNGHLVPLRVLVDSPMTEGDHVNQIVLLSSRNPVTRMAVFTLGPWSGRAEVGTRVRLAGTQVVAALARISDGSFRLASAEVVVTESACLDMG